MEKNVTGDGSSTFFWYENWHPLSPLCQEFTDEGLKSLRMAAKATVDQLWDKGEWQWPDGRKYTKEIQRLRQNTPKELVLNPGRKDGVYWTAEKSGIFSVKSAVEKIRGQGQKVYWYKLVWGKGYIPRYAMILWLLCIRRLNTKDRLEKWRVRIIEEECVLCQAEKESIEHLFFC